MAILWKKKLRWSLQQRGVGGTLRAAARWAGSFRQAQQQVLPHPFDVRYGVDTGGVISGGALGAGHAHDRYITAYAAIPPSRFHEAIRRWLETLSAIPAERYSFVDLGCGKGRALLLASKLHFREVIGVELDPELAKIAADNVERWKRVGQAPRPLQVVCGDAIEFALPPGPCLIYLANPFGAPVMRQLLMKLEERAMAGGESVEILYQNPYQEGVFAEFPNFVLLWSEVIGLSAEDVAAGDVYGVNDRCNAYRR